MIWALAAFVFLILFGMPIGFAIGLAGVVGLIDMGGTQFLAIGPSKIFNGLNIFPFLAMPFFILAGEVMNDTGITDRLVKLARVLVGLGEAASVGEAMPARALAPSGEQPISELRFWKS